MLRNIQVLQNGSGGYHPQLEVLHSKAFQVVGLEMFREPVVGRIGCEHPVFEFEYKVPGTETLFKPFAVGAFYQHLLG